MLGILLMNAVDFKLGDAPYFNLSAGGSESWLDWAVGMFGEVFVDQKFMGLFSLLFGAGMILFIDRASRRGRRAVVAEPVAKRAAASNRCPPLPVLEWRRADGLCNIVALSDRAAEAAELVTHLHWGRRVRAIRWLCAAGTVHRRHDQRITVRSLGAGRDFGRRGYRASVLLGFFLRALGLILVGAGLYRTGFMDGGLPARTYRRAAMVGLAVGLPLAAAGVIIIATNDYSREVAFIGQIPNTLGTIPASLGYMSLIILWNNRAENRLKQRLRAVGRMALTNYLAQTVLGVLALTILLGGCRLREPKRGPGVRVRGVGAAGVVVASLAEPLPVRNPRSGSGGSLHIAAGSRCAAPGTRGMRPSKASTPVRHSGAAL